MTAQWPRPQWQDSGGQAFLLWFVFGDFEPGFTIDTFSARSRELYVRLMNGRQKAPQ